MHFARAFRHTPGLHRQPPGDARKGQDTSDNRTLAHESSFGFSSRSASGLHLAADTLGLLHNTKQIAAEDLANIVFAIALSKERLRDFRKLRAIFHSVRHRSAVEIGTKPNVLRSDEFHHVVDVLDDLFPGDVWQLAFRGLLFFPDNERTRDTFLVAGAVLGYAVFLLKGFAGAGFEPFSRDFLTG
jgi:hypothetical protein